MTRPKQFPKIQNEPSYLTEASLDITKTMPFAPDAEKGVLSCFLHNPTDLLPDFSSKYNSEFFYHPCNRLLYEVMLEFSGKGKPVAYIALSTYLQDKGLMSKIGGQGVLAELLDFVPTPTHYGYYSGILRDKYLLRKTITACNKSIDDANEYQEDVPGLIDKISSRYSEVQKESMVLQGRKTWRQIVDDYEEEWNDLFHGKKVSSIPSRWAEWNNQFGGLRPEFHVFKGKTSKGKTSLALNHLKWVAVDLGKPCLWVPYEMQPFTLITRLVADEAEVNAIKVSSPDRFVPNREERNRIAQAKERIAEAKIEIVKEAKMDAAFLYAKCMAFAHKWGEVGLIGIDYLQRIHSSESTKRMNNSDVIAMNNGMCFDAQQALACPMIIISSTNADGGTLGSQGADYDADITIEVDSDHGYKVPKWRNGPKNLEWTKMNFRKEFVRFESKIEHPKVNMPP